MKNFKIFQFQRILLIIVIIFISRVFIPKADAQQQNAQWSFYFAFEDANGAKDSLWFLLDTASTYPWSISGLYGEEPIETDSVNFQVWFYHPLDYVNGNPTERYSTVLGNINNSAEVFGPEVFATNYELPIVLTWDSSLFTTEVLYTYGVNPINKATLDNNYLFSHGGSETGWDMTLTNHVELPYYWYAGGIGNQFPLYINLERGPLGSGVGINSIGKEEFSIFPNPAKDYVLLTFPKVVKAQLRILDVNGKLVKSSSISGDRKQVNVDGLESGLYFIEIQNESNTIVKKLVVN